MALMIIANIITGYSLIIGQLLWYSAIILHIIFAICFIYHRYKNFDVNHMIPSWFIPPVGIVVACVTSEPMGAPLLSQAIFYFGFIAYLILLPIILYRFIFGPKIEDSQLPSFAVMGAPASLCLVGYLTVFKNQPNLIIVNLLLIIALIMSALILLSMIRINHFRIKFIPIYASFTFPLVIGATGLIKYAKLLGGSSIYTMFWRYLGIAELGIACVVILWVLFMMTKFVYKNILLS